MTTAVYPGSFDPCTNGHLDIIKRASKMFDKLIVAVLDNPEKKTPLFSVEERVEILKNITKDMDNIEIMSFSGLLVDFMKKQNSKVIVRGLRAVTDFEYEFQLALTNQKIGAGIETIFLSTTAEFMFLSSSTVKEVAKYGGDLSGMVTEEVAEKLKNRFSK
ncbi:MAG: pantetheine-phosphate adenylyltransferase [Clostridia bacterium]|nr:pantetheine-phosphate adenylyltransferase [Clostridia bacterium]